MLDRLKSFFGTLSEAAPRAEFGTDDPRVAAAALMFHVMEADGVRDQIEHTRMREMLSQAYAISGQELDEIVTAGDAAHNEAIDLFAFTSVLNRGLDAASKVEFIGLLWEMVYADGELHELEDNIVWRVAELIGVSQRERVEMRQKVRDRRGLGEGKWED
ncbi:TerB family tellurite resistance protein [Mesorhizobium sp. CAU 1741]|uniref:tellurite resistance TerB family protein n=1 Tax=Mesorhizobium sp. CAU 1741 TaxID=3140366 RepID=UPI00325BB264